jgi:hypothetical protein
MMGMIYQWKSEARLKVDSQVAGEELERIRTWNNGRLDARNVVEASRDPGAPLHPEFDWNDETAAAAYRVEQAKYMIRMITVMTDVPDAEPAAIRAFVSVVRDEDRSYTSIGHALSDQELRAQVLRQAWAELEAWRKRYAELIELGKVFSLIDQARIAE